MERKIHNDEERNIKKREVSKLRVREEKKDRGNVCLAL